MHGILNILHPGTLGTSEYQTCNLFIKCSSHNTLSHKERERNPNYLWTPGFRVAWVFRHINRFLPSILKKKDIPFAVMMIICFFAIVLCIPLTYWKRQLPIVSLSKKTAICYILQGLTGRRSACHCIPPYFCMFMKIVAWNPQVIKA